MSRLIEDLNPETARKARAFLLRAEDELPDDLHTYVTSTRRAQDEQIATFAQNRGLLVLVNVLRKKAGMRALAESENRSNELGQHTITKCDGVDTPSAHQSGDAFDVVLQDKFGNSIWSIGKELDAYKLLGKIGKECGLRWGGDFPPLDPVTGIGWDPFHFEGV